VEATVFLHLLNNVTHKAFYSGIVLCSNPGAAGIEYTDTNYNQINAADSVYKVDSVSISTQGVRCTFSRFTFNVSTIDSCPSCSQSKVVKLVEGYRGHFTASGTDTTECNAYEWYNEIGWNRGYPLSSVDAFYTRIYTDANARNIISNTGLYQFGVETFALRFRDPETRIVYECDSDLFSDNAYLNLTFDLTPPLNLTILQTNPATLSAGEQVQFTVKWTDDWKLNSTPSDGGYILSWNVGGNCNTWINESFSPYQAANWTIATKLIPATCGNKVISYRAYAFDSAGNVYSTPIESKQVGPFHANLLPGRTPFYVEPIVLLNTQDVHPIGLKGDQSFLNVRWNAKYVSGLDRNIGVRCYLNCPESGSDIDANCNGYQNCNYLGPTGQHSCVILYPNYQFIPTNNITCKFYDPGDPALEYIPYPTRAFKPIDFYVSTPSVSITIGQAYDLLTIIKSTGVISTNFTVNITALNNEQLIILSNPLIQTETIDYIGIVSISPRLNVLSVNPINLKILTKSNLESAPNFNIICNANNNDLNNPSLDCPQFGNLGTGYCFKNRCWGRLDVTITAGRASLPEFDLFGFIQIFIISAIIFFLKFNSKLIRKFKN